MNGGSTVNKVFAIVFGLIGLFMGFMGLAFLIAGPQNGTEWTICGGALASGGLLIYSAFSTWRKGVEKAQAERLEANRLQSLKNDRITRGEINEASTEPEILARWYYPKEQWNAILEKLVEKTRKEEIYTVIWFPIIFGVVFWSVWWLGLLLGIGFGWFFLWFRVNYIKKQFKIRPGDDRSEVIITDSYLRVNGNFIHYADGRYYLKNMTKKFDQQIGDHLHFVIGWHTSKGLPAQLDLYLPIPVEQNEDADYILETYNKARER